jgi:hypothetical protein
MTLDESDTPANGVEISRLGPGIGLIGNGAAAQGFGTKQARRQR